MQLSAEETEKIRARLASRKSIFGGSLSTAAASTATTYVPAKQRASSEEPGPQRRARSSAPGPPARQQRAQEPQGPPQKLKAAPTPSSAFDALTADTPPPEATPAGKPVHKASAAGEQRAPANLAPGNRAASLPPLQIPRNGTPPPPSSRLTPPPPSSRWTPPPPTSSLSRNSPPYQQQPVGSPLPQNRKGPTPPGHRSRLKKGQASRARSFAPQAVGGPTRSQKAADAWAAQMTKLRSETPSPSPLSRVAPLPGATQKAGSGLAASSGRQTGANRGSAPASRAGTPPVRVSAPAVERARGAARGVSAPPGSSAISRLAATAVAHDSRPRLDLAGKDLSKLPEWQRRLLENKVKEQMRQKRQREEESETDDEFIMEDESSDWRQELKSITGYDPSRFKDERFDDRSMEADWRTIQAEERRSLRMGRTEDEKAEAEELARQRAKAVKKRARTSQGFVLD